MQDGGPVLRSRRPWIARLCGSNCAASVGAGNSEHPRRHADCESADSSASDCAACSFGLHSAPLHQFEVYGARRRVCPSHPGRNRRNVIPRGNAGSAGNFYLAGVVEPVALHPCGLQQTQRAVLGGRSEVLPLRRDVGGFSPLWLQPALRPVKLHQPLAHRRCHPRPCAQSSAGNCHRNHRNRPWFQSCGGSLPLLGAGRLSVRIRSERGFYRVRFQGR